MKNQKKLIHSQEQKNLYPKSKLTEMLEIAHEDFDATIIITLKEVGGNMLTMNEKIGNLS